MSRSKEREGDDPLADLRERIASVETNVDWIKKKLDTIDRRTWWILGSVVGFGVIAILIAVLRP